MRMFEFRQPDSVAPSSLFARFTQRQSLPLVPLVQYTAKPFVVFTASAGTSSTIHTPEPASIRLQLQSIQFSGSVARSAGSRSEAV